MEIDFVEVLNLGNDGALMPLLSLLSNIIYLSFLFVAILLLYDMGVMGVSYLRNRS